MPEKTNKTIYVLNGSNMNMLGTREPEKYGTATLADVEKLCRDTAAPYGIAIEFRQSNHEGVVVDSIHEAFAKKADGIAINAAGFTTTSISIMVPPGTNYFALTCYRQARIESAYSQEVVYCARAPALTIRSP